MYKVWITRWARQPITQPLREAWRHQLVIPTQNKLLRVLKHLAIRPTPLCWFTLQRPPGTVLFHSLCVSALGFTHLLRRYESKIWIFWLLVSWSLLNWLVNIITYSTSMSFFNYICKIIPLHKSLLFKSQAFIRFQTFVRKFS